MGSTQIFEAATKNDLERVKYLVEKDGVSVSVTNRIHETIAHVAVRNNNLDMLKYVLFKDSSLLKIMNDQGSTIFQLAVEHGNLAIVEYLVEEHDADIFDRYVHDYHIVETALERVIKYGHLDILKYFVEERRIGVDAPNANQHEPLIFLAIESKNSDILRYLIEEAKAKLTTLNSKGENILFVAVKQNDLNFMKDVLDKMNATLDINWKRRADGQTLMHRTVINRHMTLMQYLVEERNADVKIADYHGKTPLHYAPTDYKFIKYLITHGADVNKKDRKGKSVLQRYVKFYKKNVPFEIILQGDLNFLRYLLDVQKIEFDFKGIVMKDKTLIELAYEHKLWTMLQYLAEEKKAMGRPTELGKFLLESVKNSNSDEKSRLLVRLGADLQLKDENGNSPLHIISSRDSSLNGMEPLYRYFVEQGSDVNQENGEGNTPLLLAVHSGNEELCEYLIQQNADINRKDSKGETPLHLAVSSRNNELCEYLIQQHADINRNNSKGETALHLAVSSRNNKLCEYLIQQHADINRKNSKRETPLLLAVSSRNYELCEYLIQQHANINQKNVKGETPLHIAVSSGNEKFCEYLIKQNASINPRTWTGETPLHLAASQGNKKVCEFLVKGGGNINWKNDQGVTPLHNTLINGHEHLFIYLASCNTTIVDMYETPILHFAASRDYIDVLNYMIVKRKADVNLRTKYKNQTALHYAALNKSKKSFELLVKYHANVKALDIYGHNPLDLLPSEVRRVKHRYPRNVKFSRASYLHTHTFQNRFVHLGITGNVGFPDHLSSVCSTQLLPFLTFIQLIARNLYKEYYAEAIGEKLNSMNFSATTRLRDRMDPSVEKAIITPPNIRE